MATFGGLGTNCIRYGAQSLWHVNYLKNKRDFCRLWTLLQVIIAPAIVRDGDRTTGRVIVFRQPHPPQRVASNQAGTALSIIRHPARFAPTVRTGQFAETMSRP